MILKFDKPITLEEARNTYSDAVKFITSTDNYPNVAGVEFNCDPKLIFKRDYIEPKITKQVDKIISKHEAKIKKIWNRSFKSVLEITSKVEKADTVSLTTEQKASIWTEMEDMFASLDEASEKPYTDAFKLGKVRGQILSNQEIDNDLTDDDEAEIEDYLQENRQYLNNFKNSVKEDLDVLLDKPYGSIEELEQTLTQSVKVSKFPRALMYALATLGLVVAGTIVALKAAKAEEGHRIIRGGIWTLHPNEGQGGPVCKGCEENSGQWFNLDEFWNEYQTNDCLTNCRCDLRYMEGRIAP